MHKHDFLLSNARSLDALATVSCSFSQEWENYAIDDRFVAYIATLVLRLFYTENCRSFTDAEIRRRISLLDISFVFSNASTMHGYNLNYRGIDRPTNVIALQNCSAQEIIAAGTMATPLIMGDVILAEEIIRAEATFCFRSHLTHLLIHGVLHLLGYDHVTANDALVMEGLEIRLLRDLGLGNPYLLST